jgi:hypothetical protein
MAKLTVDAAAELQTLWFKFTKRGYWKTLPEEVSKLYLEWQFGIAPLASDVARASAEIDGLIERPTSSKITIIGSGREESAPSDIGFRDFTYCVAHQQVMQWRIDERRYKGKVTPWADPLGLRRFGLYGDNGLTSLWEGTPFSFAFDYISNAQQVLEYTRFWWTNVDYIVEGTKNTILTKGFAGIAKNQSGYDFINVSGGSWVSRTTRVMRTSTSIPVPTLQFEIPGGWQVANLAALATVLSKGSAPPLATRG